MNPSEQEGPLRDVVGLLEQWRGRKTDCHVWDALTNSSIPAFRATIGDLEIEPDRDDAEARVEVHFKEPGHLLVLYSVSWTASLSKRAESTFSTAAATSRSHSGASSSSLRYSASRTACSRTSLGRPPDREAGCRASARPDPDPPIARETGAGAVNR